MCSVLFKKPAVQPTTLEQQEAFDKLEEPVSNGDLSRMFVWLVKQRKYLSDKKLLKDVRIKLQGKFSGRTLENWSLLLVWVSKVNFYYANCHHVVLCSCYQKQIQWKILKQ